MESRSRKGLAKVPQEWKDRIMSDEPKTKIKMQINHDTDRVEIHLNKGTQSMTIVFSRLDAIRLSNKLKELCDPEARVELEL